MNMGKIFGAFLIALACALPRTASAGGDVRSIEFYGNPQGEVGVVSDLSRPLVAGDKVQFKIRLANREWMATENDNSYVNPWMLRSLVGAGAISNRLPQVGLRVSGGLRYADIVSWESPEGDAGLHFTDLICRYTVQAGDFALPLKLANTAGTAAAMEADPSDTGSTPEQKDYYLSQKSLWGFFPRYPTDNATTNRLEFYFGPEVLPQTSYPGADDYKDSEVRDYDLSRANIQIMAVDFDSTYADEDNGVWRNIAAGTTTATPALPRLSIPGGASGTYTYYVWTKDPTIADIEGGTSYTFKDGVTRKVGTVSVVQGEETQSFAIRAQAGQVGKTTEVYMADTPTNIYNRSQTLLTNFTVRAITIVDPPPPSITVTLDPVDGVASTSTNNYLSVATLDVELSEAWTQDVTVLVTPSMRSGSGTDPFTYIGMSTVGTGNESYDGTTIALTVKAGNTKASDAGTMLYVYANRANDDTAKGIRFTPTIDSSSANAAAATAFFTGTYTPATLQINASKPVITYPRAGHEYLNIPANTPTDFTITVADAMWQLHGKTAEDGKYTVYIDYNGTGAYEPISNLTANASGEITFQYRYKVGGRDYNTKIYVENQDGVSSGKEDALAYTVRVNVAKKVEVTSDHAPKNYYGEGEIAELSFKFTEAFDYASDAYVFLEPANDDSRDLVECDAFEYGIPISVGSTEPVVTAQLEFKDGKKSTGTPFKYNVVVRSTDDPDDDTNIISVWGSDGITLYATNVVPTVESLSMNDTPVYENGATMPGMTAVGVQNTFEIAAWDESADVDLEDADFTTVVKFYVNGQCTGTKKLYGNPYGQTFTHAFNVGGDGVKNQVSVYVYDKDMTAKERQLAEMNAFTVYIPTAAKPAISISSANSSTSFLETDTGSTLGRLNIDLNMAPTETITVHLDVERVGDDDGNYALPVLSRSDLTFASGVTHQEVFFTDLDGTSSGSLKGYQLVASVTTDTPSSDATKTWARYYAWATNSFYVSNVDPTIISPGAASTNTVAINVPYTITYMVKDIEVDQKTMTVTWIYNGGTESSVMDVSTGAIKKDVTFTSSGKKEVILTVTDKDGGSASLTYYFYVAPSKSLELYPRTPRRGYLSQFASKYANAVGVGAGRVWASGATAPTEISKFVHKWSYSPEDLSANVYARGYKVGDVDDGTLTPDKDFAISSSGSAATAAPYYEYANDSGKDSFFYTWILDASDGGSGYTGTHLNGVVSPEVFSDADGEQKVALPEYDESAVTYDVTVLEAIFSLEYRTTDNVGDINQDGIPDIYAAGTDWHAGALYKAAGYELDDEEAPGDLKPLASWNGDTVSTDTGFESGDFLPASSASGTTLMPNVVNWATSGGKFTAFLELRGYHEGLNYRENNDGLNRNVRGTWVSEPDFSDAEWVAIAYHNPDAGVTVEDALEDLDGAKTNLTTYIKSTSTSWIPENRTDPTVDDTDEDGFPDGFEYFYWYSATVGKINDDGKWERLEGWRFSLDDIATGERITPDEVAEAFNPTVKFSGDASTRDTDNDGLTDLEELTLGTNAINWDTDGDGLSDYWEVMNGMNPISTAKNSSGVSEGGDMNADGDFMARYDTEATYAVIEIEGKGLFALPGNGAVALVFSDGDNTTATLRESSKTALSAIKVFRYGSTNENVYVASFRGGSVTNTAENPGVSTAAKPLDQLLYYDLGDATNATFTVKRDQSISLIHDEVYAQFGYDPRTAWNKTKNGYVAARWEPSHSGSHYEGNSGLAVNTVPFTARDEYLLLKYRYETGVAGFDLAKDKTTWAKPDPATVFLAGTTCPNVPFSAPDWIPETMGDVTVTSEQHGADTDGDGVPDGWELYVKHNPNVKDADDDDDGDKLSLSAEYAGTDSCAAYASCGTISTNAPGAATGWYNKFFPTDPWDADTDGDGLTDAEEGSTWTSTFFYGSKTGGTTTHTFTFIYGSPSDDGSTCIRGGGLNPCTVDTDGDCLPDPWEREFAGVVFTAEGQPAGSLNLSDSKLTLIRRSDGLGSGATAVSPYITAGMDGTFSGDAWTSPSSKDPATDTVRDYDFDHDGLQNYQEYLVQALRHLRYDDASTPLMGQWMPSGSPDSLKFFGFLPMNVMDGETFYTSVKAAGYPATGAWNFRKLGYFAVPPHEWDKAACNTRTKGRLKYDAQGYRVMLPPQAVSGKVQAAGYCSTDPRNWDTDGDGMDDYYEIFHGLNPLLGDISGNNVANDVIYNAYAGAGVTVCFWYNAWMGWPTEAPEELSYDAMKYPWLIGTPGCDADGDGLNNYEETLYANITSPQPTHTDPTPLWMTDSTSANKSSFTAQYYKMDCDAETPDMTIYPWTATDENGFMFAFEENEGYDTDHDGLSDSEEKKMTATELSDPLNFADPDRRQALWFPGTNSAAISYACAPRNTSKIFFDALRQFTVEAWVNPEDVTRDQVIIERAVLYAPNTLSNNVSKLRANFRIGLRADGRLYGMFDTSDAVTTEQSGSSAVVNGPVPEVGKWTHVALTFDGKQLSFYVNGMSAGTPNTTTLVPANGVLSISQLPQIGTTSTFPVSGSFQMLEKCAIVLGAHALTKDALLLTENPTNATWEVYGSFFKGYIDEVRVWDGAKSADSLLEDYKTRLTVDDVASNRTSVYEKWLENATRNDNDSMAMLPVELVYHYNFQTLPGATEPEDVMWEPSGFTKNVLDNVRVVGKEVPGDLYCGWWYKLLVHSTVYANYRWVPWIPNTVSHLTALDGSTVDSRYWAEYVAGICAPSEVTSSLETYKFPNTMNPYSYFHDLSGNDVTYYNNRLASIAELESAYFDDSYLKYRFHQTRLSLGTTDLIPLGGAFAKRCTEMWDGLGVADAWTVTGDDLDSNGIPDWWESVAQERYGAAAEGLTWDSLVDYNGLTITAREAYIRDLANGMQPNGLADEAYVNTTDRDGDGIADWWETIYGISSEDGRVDSDHDGLSNFMEYLCSEFFSEKGFPRISPLESYSKSNEDVVVPDYFLKVGSLYLGEMFTDHDFCEDEWEDLYATTANGTSARLYASRFVSDLWADYDNDGWSNWAECRAGTDPTRENETSYVEASAAEYPVPTVEVAANYNGSTSVGGQIVVRAYKTNAEAGTPDASWTMPIGGDTTDDEADSSSSTSSTEDDTVGTTYTRQLGLNPGGKVTYTLGNGSVVPGTVEISFRDLNSYAMSEDGSGLWKHASDTSWCTGLRESFTGAEKESANLVMGSSRSATPVGTVNYKTGEVTIDFSKLDTYLYKLGDSSSSQGSYTYTWGAPSSGTAYERLAIANAYVKIEWRGQVAFSEKSWAFNLVQAAKGHLRGGENVFDAFIDLDGDGEWDAGEPYDVVTGVDVGWSRVRLSFEFTDTAPQMVRFDLAAAAASNDFDSQKSLNDRGVASSISVGSNREVLEDYVGENMPEAIETATRVRLVRTALNDLASYQVNKKISYADGVALDVTKNLVENPMLSERDLLQTGTLDLDWGALPSVASSMGISFANLTSVVYRVVLGDGPAFLADLANQQSSTSTSTNKSASVTVQSSTSTVQSNTDTNEEETVSILNNLATAFVNTYEVGVNGAQTKCVPVNVESTVYGARPTFSWTHANKINKDYPAFRLRVWKSNGTTLVYDSGVRKAPPRDANGVYSWVPPIYADMVTPVGVVFSTTNNYKWSVSMLDAKFTAPNTDETKADFRLECSGVGGGSTDYGSAKVSVKYFGPGKTSFKASTLAGIVRVQAFGSPDFSGEPAAEGFLHDGTVMTSQTSNAVNCTVIGLPAGTYYVRAYIDSNGNGAFDPWESWGYANAVGTGAAALYTPKAIEIVQNDTTQPFVTVYIEDMDTDGDGFPDVYEYDVNKNLTTLGPAAGNTFFTRVNPNLAKTLSGLSSLASANLASTPLATMLSLASDGASQNTLALANLLSGAPADEPAITESVTVSIASFSLADGITLETTTTVATADSAYVAASDGAKVVVSLVAADSLDFADATEAAVKTITIHANATEQTVITADELKAVIDANNLSSKAFFKAKLTSAE